VDQQDDRVILVAPGDEDVEPVADGVGVGAVVVGEVPVGFDLERPG
jgi:hypothetical protein